MIILSRSIIEDAARCKRKFMYKQLEGLKAQVSSQGASEGTLIHAGLAGAYEHFIDHDEIYPGGCYDCYDYMKRAAKERIRGLVLKGTSPYRGVENPLSPIALEDENIDRIVDVVNYYIDNQIMKDMFGATVVAVETNFIMPLEIFPPGIPGVTEYGLEGQIDLILKKEIEGRTVYQVFDHKTIGESGSIQKNLDFLRLDVQFLVYEWLVTRWLEQQTDLYDGKPYSVEMVYNLIRRQRPPGYGSRELRLNKDGSVSKTNASQDRADYLRQEKQAHSEQELLYVEAELANLCRQAIGLQAAAAHEDASYFTRTVIKSGEEACTGCDFFSKCSTELVGHGRPNWDMQPA